MSEKFGESIIKSKLFMHLCGSLIRAPMKFRLVLHLQNVKQSNLSSAGCPILFELKMPTVSYMR